MQNQQMRSEILKISDTKSWRKRVMNMSDGQVFAIYKKQQAKLEQEKLDAKSKTDTNSDIPF